MKRIIALIIVCTAAICSYGGPANSMTSIPFDCYNVQLGIGGGYWKCFPIEGCEYIEDRRAMDHDHDPCANTQIE